MSMNNANDDEITPDKLAELRAAASKGPRLERENLALRAGITSEGPVFDAFIEKYTGELTVDALRTEAQKWNLWAPPAPAATNPPPATDPAAAATNPPPAPAAAPASAVPGAAPADPYAPVPDAGQQAIREALAGGTPVGTAPLVTAHPMDEALTAFHADVASGRNTSDRASLAVIDKIIVAAANGDKRVIFDPVAYRQQAEEYGA